MFYLDANTCIYYLNGKSDTVKYKILSMPPNQIAIPSIVKAELILSAYKSKSKEKTLDKVEKFLQPFEIIPFEDQICYHYAEIRSYLEKIGKIIGPNDLIIAAITRFHNAILVTNNTEEFCRVPDLKIDNWY